MTERGWGELRLQTDLLSSRELGDAVYPAQLTWSVGGMRGGEEKRAAWGEGGAEGRAEGHSLDTVLEDGDGEGETRAGARKVSTRFLLLCWSLT